MSEDNHLEEYSYPQRQNKEVESNDINDVKQKATDDDLPPRNENTLPADWPQKRRLSDPYSDHIDENGEWCVDDRVLEDYYIMPWEEPGYVDEPPSQDVIDAIRKEQEAFDRKWEEISRFANNRFAVLDEIRSLGGLEPLKNNHDGGNRPKPTRI